jgi:hypothetical protein
LTIAFHDHRAGDDRDREAGGPDLLWAGSATVVCRLRS